MRHLTYNLALLLALGVFAVAQDMPSQRQPQQIPQGNPQVQQPAPDPRTDQIKPSNANPGDVQKEIQTALQKDPTLGSANINVQATSQSVELTGTVPSRDAKDMAEQIAKAHSSGLPVKNHLKVGEGSKGAPPY
jgi:hypothetical protein